MPDRGRKPPSREGENASRPSPVGADPAEIRRLLHAFVRRYSPPWMRNQIEDIVQLAWIRLQQAAERSDRNRNPGTTLLAKVAFCTVMDENRRMRRRREVALSESNVGQASAIEDPSRAVRAGEIRRALQDCLVSMTENRSLAVTLYLQGHTAPQTAQLLGWSLTRTENLIYRGLNDLRRCLTAKGIFS